MDTTPHALLEAIRSGDKTVQNEGYYAAIAATDQPVPWAYEVWDTLVAMLGHKDNYYRAIAAQLLSNLAKSDPEQRMVKDFPTLLAVTKDARFVTARHCMQSLWKVGVVEGYQQLVVEGLEGRFYECTSEKNCTLIRYDIIENLKKIDAVVHDARVRETAMALIESEADLKYRKKYASVWRETTRARA
jgi:hypothetical protein